jgi:hypothetical protein
MFRVLRQRERGDVSLFVNSADVSFGSVRGKCLPQAEHCVPHGFVRHDASIPYRFNQAIMGQQLTLVFNQKFEQPGDTRFQCCQMCVIAQLERIVVPNPVA